MKKILFIAALFTLVTLEKSVAQETTTVSHFDKVIVSPHVQATFTKGDKETVTILNCTANKDKVHIENNGKTLRVYLEGAKELNKSEKVEENGRKIKKDIYTGTVLTVAITYKALEDLSVRGEEMILLKSKLDQENFDLTIYGESNIQFNDVQLGSMHTTTYGESTVDFKSGEINEHRITSYGESKVNALAISNKITKATLYGEAELNLNVSDLIKVTSFGEAKINYKGSAQVRKSLNIGGVQVHRIN